MTKKLLVVCLGNICRSPLAEAILGVRLREAGLDVEMDSAGTGGWHAGDPPDARAVVAARLKGYDITQIRARTAHANDFQNFDIILTMDESTTSAMEDLRPSSNDTPVHQITDFAVESGASEVPDPYYTGKFNDVIDLLEDCAAGLRDQLLKARQ